MHTSFRRYPGIWIPTGTPRSSTGGAASYGNGGIGAWDPIQVLEPFGGGRHGMGGIEASPIDGAVTVLMSGGAAHYRYSTDFGATWPESQSTPSHVRISYSLVSMLSQPSLGAMLSVGFTSSGSTLEVSASRAALSLPDPWG